MASITAAPLEFQDRCHLPVKIYYEDTDCVGIVYHSNYLKYFERGRELLLGQDELVGLFDSSGRSFVVVNVKIAFLEFSTCKTHYGEPVTIVTQILLSHNVRYATFSPPLNRGYLDLRQRFQLMEVRQVNLQCLHRENPAHP